MKKRRKNVKKSSFTGRIINPQKFSVRQLKFYLYLVPLCLFTGLPIVFIFNNAFKSMDDLFKFPPSFFVKNPTLVNFINLMKSAESSAIPLSRYIFNSILVTFLVVLSSIALSSLAGFALSKMKFRFKKILFEINTIALMFVGVAVAVPRFLIISKIGLIDTLLVHILPLIAIPVGLFLVKQFIDQIPDVLIEAAKIDGAGEFYIYFHIILPLIKPALATVAILAFQSAWNNIETSNIFTNSESLRTLAFYLNTLTQTNGNTVAGQGMAAAASLIMFVPNLILFIILQSQVMDTMAHSGIK